MESSSQTRCAATLRSRRQRSLSSKLKIASFSDPGKSPSECGTPTIPKKGRSQIWSEDQWKSCPEAALTGRLDDKHVTRTLMSLNNFLKGRVFPNASATDGNAASMPPIPTSNSMLFTASNGDNGSTLSGAADQTHRLGKEGSTQNHLQSSKPTNTLPAIGITAQAHVAMASDDSMDNRCIAVTPLIPAQSETEAILEGRDEPLSFVKPTQSHAMNRSAGDQPRLARFAFVMDTPSLLSVACSDQTTSVIPNDSDSFAADSENDTEWSTMYLPSSDDHADDELKQDLVNKGECYSSIESSPFDTATPSPPLRQRSAGAVFDLGSYGKRDVVVLTPKLAKRLRHGLDGHSQHLLKSMIQITSVVHGEYCRHTV